MATTHPTSTRHEQILLLDLKGTPQKQIAERLGVTPVTVGNVQRSQLYKERRKDLLEKVENGVIEAQVEAVVGAREILDAAASRAAQVNVQLLESPNPGIAQRSCWDILDRTGYAKEARLTLGGALKLDEEAARALGEALREVQE